MPELNLGHIRFSSTETRYTPPERRRRKRRKDQPRAVTQATANPKVGPLFELVSGRTSRPLQERSSLPTTMVSMVAHIGVFGVAFVLFSLSTGIALPTPHKASNLIAVVVAAPPPPPPPAPAAPAPTRPAAPEAVATPAAPPPPPEVPLQALAVALPAFVAMAPEELPPGFGSGGLGPGPQLVSAFGVEGGVGWGSGSGSPPAQGPTKPVKVEGASAPTLVHRVEPVYPKEASAARVQGTVVLEATVDQRGLVEEVRVLRSIELLDAAAIAAVKQWRYEPLTVAGEPASFILTVNVSFHLR